MNRLTLVDLTPSQTDLVATWLHSLGYGLYHNGINVSTISHHRTLTPEIVRDEYGLYAICGNASLRLES